MLATLYHNLIVEYSALQQWKTCYRLTYNVKSVSFSQKSSKSPRDSESFFSSYKIDVARVASHAAIKSLSRTNFAKDWELY